MSLTVGINSKKYKLELTVEWSRDTMRCRNLLSIKLKCRSLYNGAIHYRGEFDDFLLNTFKSFDEGKAEIESRAIMDVWREFIRQIHIDKKSEKVEFT